MKLYATPDMKDIPSEVRLAWQQFADEYARDNKLDVIAGHHRWEVPMIVPDFPAVGLLLYQHDNRLGNCRKVIIQAGYDAIKHVERDLDRKGVKPYTEIDYENGMALPLHRHPKLAYTATRQRFVGSVVAEQKIDGKTLYRVRSTTPRGVKSHIYASCFLGEKARHIAKPSGIVLAKLIATESMADYPKGIRPLKEYATLDTTDSIWATIRTGKQEQFVGHSDAPMLLGGKGKTNLSDFAVTIPGPLEENVVEGFRHLTELHRGQVSDPVGFHWLLTGTETAVVGELSGKPDLGKGSEDAGDLFYNRRDPLFLLFMRSSVQKGH